MSSGLDGSFSFCAGFLIRSGWQTFPRPTESIDDGLIVVGPTGRPFKPSKSVSLAHLHNLLS